MLFSCCIHTRPYQSKSGSMSLFCHRDPSSSPERDFSVVTPEIALLVGLQNLKRPENLLPASQTQFCNALVRKDKICIILLPRDRAMRQRTTRPTLLKIRYKYSKRTFECHENMMEGEIQLWLQARRLKQICFTHDKACQVRHLYASVAFSDCGPINVKLPCMRGKVEPSPIIFSISRTPHPL